MTRLSSSALKKQGIQTYSCLRKLTLGLVSIIALFGLLAMAVQGNPVKAQTDNPSNPEAVNSWNIQSINPQKLFYNMGNRSLQMDSDGKAHLAYGGDHLYYAKRVGSGGNCGPSATWLCEVVDLSDNVGQYASLALDGGKNPHIAYYDANNGALKYAKKVGGVWQIATIDQKVLALKDDAPQGLTIPENLALNRDWRTSTDWEDILRTTSPDGLNIPAISGETSGVGLYPAIKVNSDGDAYVAYYDSINGDLKFNYAVMNTWSTPVVVDSYDLITETVGLYPSLAIAGGNVYISYYSAAKGNLKFAKSSGTLTTWDKQNVDAIGDPNCNPATSVCVSNTSVAAIGSDRYAISYYDAKNKDLKYAEWTGAAWDKKVVDSGGDVGQYCSLALGASNAARISYFDGTNSDLRYAVWNGSTWSIQTVLIPSQYVGRFTSLALDSNGRARISFYDKGLGQLDFAIQHPTQDTSWTIEAIDNSVDEGLFSSLVFDSVNNPRISFFDDIRDQLKYAFWNGSSWTVQVVDTGNAAGLYSHLALDSSGGAHISYWDAGNLRIKYAKWTGSAWQSENVPTNPTSPVGPYSAIAIDSSGYPWIAYYDASNKDLELTWKTSPTTWRSTPITVDADGDVGQYLSMVIDKSNPAQPVAHISYYDATNKWLKYAKCPPFPCKISVPDWGLARAGQVGLFTSIALDSGKNPHITYMDDSGDHLKYTYSLDGGVGWNTQTVDSAEGAGYYPSIALTGSGQTVISYYDLTNSNLKYAAWSGGIWDYQILDSAGDVGMYSSIAITNDNQVGISYYDASNGDLKYVSSSTPPVIIYDNFIYLPLVIKSLP